MVLRNIKTGIIASSWGRLNPYEYRVFPGPL